MALADCDTLSEYSTMQTKEKETANVITLQQGASFGKTVLVKDIPRQSTVITREQSYFICLNRREFIKILG